MVVVGDEQAGRLSFFFKKSGPFSPSFFSLSPTIFVEPLPPTPPPPLHTGSHFDFLSDTINFFPFSLPSIPSFHLFIPFCTKNAYACSILDFAVFVVLSLYFNAFYCNAINVFTWDIV